MLSLIKAITEILQCVINCFKQIDKLHLFIKLNVLSFLSEAAAKHIEFYNS